MFDFESFVLDIARLETDGFSAESLQMTQKEVQNLAQNLFDAGFTDIKASNFGEVAFEFLAATRQGLPLSIPMSDEPSYVDTKIDGATPDGAKINPPVKPEAKPKKEKPAAKKAAKKAAK